LYFPEFANPAIVTPVVQHLMGCKAPLMTLEAYPQRQKAASFNFDEVLANLKESRDK
jgi:hypothetical protein